MAGATGAVAALSACGNSLGNDSSDDTDQGAIKVGLVIPQAGVYAPVGLDMKRGWDLWLERHGGKAGGYTVTTVAGDEGESPSTGVPAVQRLLQSDNCHVLVGVVSSPTALGVRDVVTESKKLLLIGNAGAEDITGKAASPYIWRTSFTNAQVSGVMGRYLAEQGTKDGVFAIASDYAAGAEAIAGFQSAYEGAGGAIAGSAKSPFQTTQDYQPFLAQIQSSGAKATFCFFAGAEAVAFVKQYQQFGLAGTIPLYGSGFLTEGGVLTAQGAAAVGTKTSLHYTSELDNQHNKDFVSAYQKKYDAVPTVYAVQMWDTASVLDRALKAAKSTSGDALSKALGDIGPIDDSPRGEWSFEGQTPKQKFYIREVKKDGDGFVNAVIDETEAVGQPG
jgi:branched-chain amino acid transport system substrate-binding protein